MLYISQDKRLQTNIKILHLLLAPFVSLVRPTMGHPLPLFEGMRTTFESYKEGIGIQTPAF